MADNAEGYSMQYGYFDDDKREYIITNPKTPVKWINYIGTLAFGGFVDHTGGALICAQDPALNRIIKYIAQMPASDFNGETLYVRIQTPTPTPCRDRFFGVPDLSGGFVPSLRPEQVRESEIIEKPTPESTPPPLAGGGSAPREASLLGRGNGGEGYRIFSPYFVPTLDPYDLYECHVGLGYTRIVSEFYGIRTEATIFVPLGERRVVRDIKITNISDAPVEVDVIPVVEYTHPDSLKQLTNADWVPQTMTSKAVHDEHGRVILVQYPFMLRDTRVNYFTSNQPVSSFDSDRKKFLGDNEYGTWAQPLSLVCHSEARRAEESQSRGVETLRREAAQGEKRELTNSEALRGDNIAALLHHLRVLEPGETRRLITQLGQAESIQQALPGIEDFRDEGRVDRALEELARFWDSYLSKLQVATPDPAMNRMLNVHNPRQCHTTKNWSRYLSLYQLGHGARGIGFRDSSQDVMAVLASMPQEGKALIKQLLSVQKRNGSTMHQFNPLTLVASEGDSLEREDLPHYYSDDHLWIILAVCAYLKETSDLAFLQDVIPFYEKGKNDQPLEAGTVLKHLVRAVEFTRGDVGAHGLPLLGFADWNDTVNLCQGAESLFTADLYGKALLEMIELARYLGDAASAEKYAAYHAEMKERVNRCAWDGEWYVRYFDWDGTPLGSRANDKGQIYINGQSWPVISGFATPERARRALDSVRARLNTRNGIKISAPGFNGFDPKRGGITTYPPGAKENGGIFLHTNPWVMIAETILGNGDRAFEYYHQINPAAKNDRIDEYECEPYVYAQNILGDEHPQFGLARNSWLSGAASWAYQAGTQYILGVRPSYDGLMVDPCIPHQWDGFQVTREFRGAVYHITVVNPNHICKGVKSVQVDGKDIEGSVIPVCDSGTHLAHVVMGENTMTNPFTSNPL
jgi:cellobiose phosphorylase